VELLQVFHGTKHGTGMDSIGTTCGITGTSPIVHTMGQDGQLGSVSVPWYSGMGWAAGIVLQHVD